MALFIVWRCYHLAALWRSSHANLNDFLWSSLYGNCWLCRSAHLLFLTRAQLSVDEMLLLIFLEPIQLHLQLLLLQNNLLPLKLELLALDLSFLV